MPLLNLRQNTPEWSAYRKGKIGASLAPVIMNVSPWQTPYQLWEEMLEIRPPKAQNAAMRRGLDLEQRARNLFEIETGISVSDAVYEHDAVDWLFASFDGLSENGEIAVEIKWTKKEFHDLACNGKVPECYYPQLQHQMNVKSLNKIYYSSNYFIDEINISQINLNVPRDQSYIDQLMDKETKFIKRVRTFDPPPMTERDIEVREDFDWHYASDLYKDLIRYQKELEGRIEKAKNNLIDLSKNQNCKGNSISLTKVARKGNLDYSQIPELRQIDLEKYRKPVSSYWKISINGDE
jgi:putative phage-type endonuclease